MSSESKAGKKGSDRKLTYSDPWGIESESTHTSEPDLLDPIEQRPNAVIKNGGPQLLKGLMLPLPPSANRYWKSFLMVRKGTRFPLLIASMKALYTHVRHMNAPGEDAVAYSKHLEEVANQRGFRFFTNKPLRVDLVVCPRDRRSIDAHNYAKVILDVFEHIGVYEDDAQVEDLRVRLGPVIPGGRILVSLWEIQPEKQKILDEAWR